MNSDLLNDVLNESDYGEFRDDLKQQFRAEAGRRKWRRRIAWFAAAAAIALVAFLNSSKQPHIITQTLLPPRDVVPTIMTSNIRFDDLSVSAKEPVPVIRTHAFTAEVITTDHSKQFPSISDDELLRFFPKHPTGLMAAHGEKRFIFIDPADAKHFMSSN